MLFLLCIRMADNELQNDPKKTECTDEQEQQSPINGSTEDSNTNNVPEQLEYSRDDDRSDPSVH